MNRILLISAGSLCVALAVVGMFIPILPTTPFLLVAAFCFARSSPRFFHWLLHNRYFGDYIRNYRAGNGLPLKQKVATIALLWLTILVAVGFFGLATWVKVVLIAIASGVTFHLVRIKTYRPQPIRKPRADTANLSQEPE